MRKRLWRLISPSKTVLTTLLANHIVYYPTPANLSYAWSFGSLAGLIFAIQLISGIFLAMHYTPHVDLAFSSVEHIMSEVNGGYTFRYMHANGASTIFILMYLHIFRGLYFQSYLTRPMLWWSGLIIFLLMMATAFIGYVLPWGQMSFWGATVITSLVTAVPFVGDDVALWIWGGFSINNATLNRFFSLHYLLPFVIAALIITHLALLHVEGSSDPIGLAETPSKLTFQPYFTYKDLFVLMLTLSGFFFLSLFVSNFLGHSDNFIPANPLVTPAHIVPEWYFTPFYAILRSCPNKLGGALGMFSAIIILFVLPFLFNVGAANKKISLVARSYAGLMWAFLGVFFVLMFLGSRAAAEPYVWASVIFSTAYFLIFAVGLPILGKLRECMSKKA